MSKKELPADSVSPTESRFPKWLIPAAIVVIGAAVGLALMMGDKNAFTMSTTVVATYPHQSEKAYTQGLEFYKGFLFESTGVEGESDWRIVNLRTGEVCFRNGISSKWFGEGITILGDKLYQITWRNEKCFVYDLAALKLDSLDPKTIKKSDIPLRGLTAERELAYDGQGWGLTNDGTHIIMSSGHADGVIRYRDTDFKVVKEITVTDGNGDPVANLNELEYVDGAIYANVFQTDTILKIDAETGETLEKIDASGLLPEGTKLKPGHVLNGIARDPATGKFYVTGKNWPHLFEVRFEKK